MLQVPQFPLFTWLSFLFILVICWKRSKAKGQIHKLPPGPWKLPLIGNLHQLVFSLPHRSLRDLAKKYGPIMQLQLGEVLAIIISSPKVAEEVLKTHDAAFANRPSVLAVEIVGYDNSSIVFAPYGDYWRQMRKICVLELLSPKRVRSFKTIREEEVWNLVESVSLSQGLPINLSEKIFTTSYCITSRAAIGKKCKYEQELLSLIKESFNLSGGFDVPDLFPSLKFLSFLTGMRPALEKLHKKLDKILDEIINEHKMKRSTTISASKHEPAGGDHDDLVDVLLKLQEMGELEFDITSNQIKAVTQDVFAAASETSASTIEWAMSELMRNPRVMAKAQNEVRQILKRTRNIDEIDIQKLDYLKLVVKETLRLHPPGALIPRESREKCEINGYEIPSNTKVIINAWAIGRDPTYWIDADCFHPERFHGSSVDFKGTNFEFIPFGSGRRICPGKTLQFKKPTDFFSSDCITFALSKQKKKKKKTNRYCDTEKGKEKIKNLQSSGESCDQTFVPEILRYGDRDRPLGSPPTVSEHSTTKPSPPPPYLEVHHMAHLPAAAAARSDHNSTNNGECGGRLS